MAPPHEQEWVRSLRRAQTEAERLLWSRLRRAALGRHFRRQHPIPPYVADFACIALKIIVEADGGQHNESPRDATRDFVMSARGWQILRFWTSEITENLDGVIEVIRAACVARTPSPTLLRAGGRGS